MAALNGWTPTEKRIWDIIKDGKRHHRDELLAALQDSEADYRALNQRLCHMRKRVKEHGKDILCLYRERTLFYRLVKVIAHDE